MRCDMCYPNGISNVERAARNHFGCHSGQPARLAPGTQWMFPPGAESINGLGVRVITLVPHWNERAPTWYRLLEKHSNSICRTVACTLENTCDSIDTVRKRKKLQRFPIALRIVRIYHSCTYDQYQWSGTKTGEAGDCAQMNRARDIVEHIRTALPKCHGMGSSRLAV